MEFKAEYLGLFDIICYRGHYRNYIYFYCILQKKMLFRQKNHAENVISP